MLRSYAVRVLAVATASALVACSSSGGSNPGPSGTPSSSATGSTASTSSAPAPITQPSRLPSKVKNKVGLISHGYVSRRSCKAVTGGGGWTMTGTARGIGGKAAHYTVTVYFTTPKATVQAYGTTKVSVPAGKTVTWTVTKKFRAVDKTQCVIVGAG